MNQSDALFEIPDQLPEWAKRLVVFDTETTGLDLTQARIVTACAVEIDANGEIASDRAEWLADPEIEIPEATSNVHGVTTEIARSQGRKAADVVSEIVETLRGYLDQGVAVVAYNAPYDFTILHYEALRHGIKPLGNPFPVLDPLVLDKKFDQYRSGKRNLERVCEIYGVKLLDAHNATADAVAAGRLMQAIARKHAAVLGDDIATIHSLQVQVSNERDLSFQDYMRKSKDPNFTVQLGWPTKLGTSLDE